MNRTPCIIVDIDGTCADLTHRRHHVVDGNRNWKAFFAEASGDDPIEEVIKLVQILHDSGNVIILVSGRTSDIRGITENWLKENQVPYAALHMRASGDFRPDHVVKKQILEGIRHDGFEPWLAIDDRPSILEMWESEGIKTLACKSTDNVVHPPRRAPTLQILVGPSGAGKTTWISDNLDAGSYTTLISSDGLREELCGDFRDQSKNNEVFSALHALVKARLWAGLDVLVDATNIRNKDRKEVVALAPENASIEYIVIDRPLEEKRKSGGWRNQLDFDLIGKHDQTFKSNIGDILAGDGNPNIKVVDLRTY